MSKKAFHSEASISIYSRYALLFDCSASVDEWIGFFIGGAENVMNDYSIETVKRVEFIRGLLADSGARGIVFGNSGGKDSVLVGILCKLACEDTLGIIMPCGSKRNYTEDTDDAASVAEQFNIKIKTVDLAKTYSELSAVIARETDLSGAAQMNIAPRLRMTTLYAFAASEGRLVAGTGNRSEMYMGYFTKWGDGAYDFNPIADLTVREIYEYLEYFCVPSRIIEKAPSAGLTEGQTDEGDMGVSYSSIDDFLLKGNCPDEDRMIIDKYHNASEHKRKPPVRYGAD